MQWLKENSVPAMYGVDTRALTKKLRIYGVPRPYSPSTTHSGLRTALADFSSSLRNAAVAVIGCVGQGA